MKPLITIGIIVVTICSWALGQTLVFPHMAHGLIGDGTEWITEILVVNTTSSEQTVKVSFFNQDGTPMLVGFPGSGPIAGPQRASVVEFKLSPNEMRVISTDG